MTVREQSGSDPRTGENWVRVIFRNEQDGLGLTFFAGVQFVGGPGEGYSPFQTKSITVAGKQVQESLSAPDSVASDEVLLSMYTNHSEDRYDSFYSTFKRSQMSTFVPRIEAIVATLNYTDSATQTVPSGSSQIAITGTYRVNEMIGIAKFIPDKPSDIESIGFTNNTEANEMFHQRFVSVADNCSTETRSLVRVTGLSKNTATSDPLSPSHTATFVAAGPYSGPGEVADLIEVICGEAISPAEAAARTPRAGEVAVLLYYDDESKRICYGESGICSMRYDVKTKVIPSVPRIADATLRQLFTEYFPELAAVYSDVSIVNGVAYVNFTKDGEKYLDAPPGMSGAYMHSIKKTLLQFDTIKDVGYKIEGALKTSFDA